MSHFPPAFGCSRRGRISLRTGFEWQVQKPPTITLTASMAPGGQRILEHLTTNHEG